MARRRRSTPSISFFSFQDLITSVTGIMILLSLLLALSLTQRSPGRPTAHAAEAVDAVRESLAESRAHVAALQGEVRQGEQELAELAGLSVSGLQRQTSEARQQASDLRTRTDRLNNQRQAAQTRAQARESELAGRETDRRRLERQQREAARLAAELAEMKSGKRMFFEAPPDGAKFPWLVEVTGSALRLRLLGRERPPLQFEGGTDADRRAQFRQWLRTLDSGSEYVLLLVKPSGLSQYQDLYDLIRSAGLDQGIDLVSEEQQVLAAGGGL